MKSNKSNKSEKLIVFDIKRFAIHDGPGIRTTVFLQGCPLRCGWCHNPEGISIGKGPKSKKIELNELFEEIIKDKPFYEISKGGVSFSGGEPMLQFKPLTKLLRMCKKSKVNTAVETCGHCNWEAFEKIIPFVDLFFYDLKHIDNKIHKKGTGSSNKIILDNLKKLDKRGCNIVIRIPLISGFNDDKKTFSDIGKFLSELKNIRFIEVLPFNVFAESKYSKLGKKIDEKFTKILSQQKINELTEPLRKEIRK